MSLVIMIEGQKFGPHEMANSICLPDDALTGKKDGEEVEFSGKGILVEHDGKRYIAVNAVDGKPVEEMEEENEPSEEESMEMTGDDALEDFMKQKRK